MWRPVQGNLHIFRQCLTVCGFLSAHCLNVQRTVKVSLFVAREMESETHCLSQLPEAKRLSSFAGAATHPLYSESDQGGMLGVLHH